MKKILCLSFLLAALLLPKPCFSATDEENKKILKDAIVGAVTGAVAVEATKDEKAPAPAPAATTAPGEAKKNFWHKKRHHHEDDDDDDQGEHHHKKDKKRPHGWDMGKKTGWGDKDVPPGLAKKEKD